MWQLPESELQILGDVAGKDVLEYGCGAAQWSILLARAGARPVALDNSGPPARARAHADGRGGRRLPARPRERGEAPLGDGSFDVVFCDHGAMTFADPYKTVPEVARLLRPGGLFAFSHTTRSRSSVTTSEADTRVPELRRPCSACTGSPGSTNEPVDFNLPQGKWIELFRDNGFVVDDPGRGSAARRRVLDLPLRGRDGVGASLADGADLEAAPYMNRSDHVERTLAEAAILACSATRPRRSSPAPPLRASSWGFS